MTPTRTAGSPRAPARALLALLLVAATAAWLITRPAAAASPSAPWAELTSAQQTALAPLQSSWSTIDAPRRKKWIEVADRFPHMPADERERVQQRMAAWASMSPTERARARIQFQETRRIGADERQARWQAYQALPSDERERLAQQAARRPAAAASSAAGQQASARAEPSAVKRNVVGASLGPTPRAVAPTVVQAKPGASTTTVATPVRPPLHHQPGLPKIIATPTFVDPNTLLPRRGPQAAAMRTAASADPTQQP